MKKFVAFIIFLALAVIFIPRLHVASADEADRNYNVVVFVDGEQVDFPDQKPYIDPAAGRTYVPIRFVSEALGATVDWDSVSQTVYIKDTQYDVSLTVGSGNYYVNSATKTLDAPPVIVGGRTMVPLRFVSEALGREASYTPWGSVGRVDIYMPGSKPVITEPKPELAQFIDGLLGGDYMKFDPSNHNWTNWINTGPSGYHNKDGVTYDFDPPDPRSDRYGLTITYDTDIDNSKKITDIRKILEQYMPDKAGEVMDAFNYKRSLILKSEKDGTYYTDASTWVHSYSENGTYTNMSAMHFGKGYDFIQLIIVFMK